MNLDRIRAKKIQDIQEGYSDRVQELETEKQIQALEELVKTKLTKKAIERYGNIKAAYPEKSIQLLLILSKAIQSYEIIDDDQVKSILSRLTDKRDFKITRK